MLILWCITDSYNEINCYCTFVAITANELKKEVFHFTEQRASDVTDMNQNNRII